MKPVKLSQWKYTGVNKNKVALNQAPKVPSVTQVSSCKGALLQVQEEERNVTPTPAFDNKTLLKPGAAEEDREVAWLLTP